MVGLKTHAFVSTLLLFVSHLCWGTVIARIEPPQRSRPVGQTFAVSILASMPDPVLGWGLDLGYDHSVLTLVGTPLIGPLWSAGLPPDGDGLSGLAFPSAISGTNVLLATLNFLAAVQGRAALTLSVTLGDLNEGFALDPSGFADASFQSGHVAVTPEPLTGVVLIMGTLMVCGRKQSGAESRA